MAPATARAAKSALVFAAFGPILWEWAGYASAVSRIDYCLLVPVLAGILAFRDSRNWQQPAQTSLFGYGLLFCGGLFLAVGSLASVFTLSILGFPIAIAALIGVFWGNSGLIQLRYPLVMLCAMVPVPLPLLDRMTPFMVKASGAAAVTLLRPFDPSASWVGADLSYRGWHLFVAEACSGSGTLLVLGTLTLFMAGLFRMSTRAILITLLLVGPITIVVNGLRIAVIAWVIDSWGPGVATGSGHEIIGQIVVIAGATTLAFVVDRFSQGTREFGS